MRNINTAVAVAAVLATSFAVSVSADTLDDVVDRGTLRCGVVLDFPPIGYRDSNNEPQALTWSIAPIWPLLSKLNMKLCR